MCIRDSCKDRPTRCYEYVFLLTKSKKYYYDWQAVAEPIAPTTAVRLKSGVGTVSYTHLDVYKRQGKNARKYRKGAEYGSARWGNAEDIKPYIDQMCIRDRQKTSNRQS